MSEQLELRFATPSRRTTAALLGCLFLSFVTTLSAFQDQDLTPGQAGCFLIYFTLIYFGILTNLTSSRLFILHDDSLTPSLGSTKVVDIENAESEKLLEKSSRENEDDEKPKPFSQWLGLPHEAESIHAITAMMELSLYMCYVYLCDRTDFFAAGPKEYNRDRFWFICLVILMVAFSTLRSCGTPRLLQRDQTEEWKGWMQIMFLLYHYFAEAEVYNAIRIFIACYVWMTGFGNFSFYYVKKDFSFNRFLHMMWRLNFFCFLCCATLNNQYMLYYICPLHTFFTILVYATLGIYSSKNSNNYFLFGKIAVAFLVVAFIWDVDGVFDLFFSPLSVLLNFTGVPQGGMYEWQFRSGLDHFITLFGMVCAFFHPNVEQYLGKLDASDPKQRFAITIVILFFSLLIGYGWYESYFVLDKISYNTCHPYTSFIPIALYILFRNLLPSFRGYYLHLFAFLGKTTLETYILQFHIWMRTTGPNGSPKQLLVFLDGWPLINFVLTSIVYLFIAYRIFHITGTLRDFFFPSRNAALSRGNLLVMVVVIFVFYFMGFVTQALL
eukprot:TRINITY_DN11423_c0_g1::TRINITY_DN11423_c0_g1_i1::g.10821::m.10821 TRINITY_DN11423_c0_g1::TRINITY_DN11423_c0_g1_i1::g.10821  ORF type:complete len:553 (+),score=77.08,sp/Q66GQ5/RWA3_ARATH/43.02/1e-144,Cas1_AcylT/PF07779.7/7.8e-92 TRINITY_DN11423_c0_g1_i1:89-1747(+)